MEKLLDVLHVRYASWDLSHVMLVDPHNHLCLGTLYPQDKSANADSLRRTHKPLNQTVPIPPPSEGIAPLLKKLMADYAATGLPPAYLPKNAEESS